MKIRNPKTIRILSWLSARLLYAWIGTIRQQVKCLGPNLFPDAGGKSQRCIYAFWHETMLLPVRHFARSDIHVLISTHADGQLITEICHELGFHTVRGSSTRGGSEALRQMLRISREAHIAITPDGPRGPRRVIQPGAIFLASRTGLPIAPVGIAFSRAWRANSWDRFAVPRPFSRGRFVMAEPVYVPRLSGEKESEAYRMLVQKRLLHATAIAEQWARTGRYTPADHGEIPTMSEAA